MCVYIYIYTFYFYVFDRNYQESPHCYLLLDRIFEGDPFEITTLCEAEHREQILQETLRRVQIRKV